MICCLGSRPIRNSAVSGRIAGLTHQGMRISESDWSVFLGHAAATLAKFQVPEAEQREVVTFVQSLKKEIVE